MVTASVGGLLLVAGRTRIVLVEAQTLVLDALREMLEAEPDLSVPGTAQSNRDAVLISMKLRPDVVLLNAGPADTDIIATVRDIRMALPDCRVIVVGEDGLHAQVLELVGLGIAGFLPKSATHHELKTIIRALVSDPGRVTISMDRTGFDRLTSANPLSAREIEILSMVDAAMTNAQIAAQLDLTEATVKRHLRSVFGKLGAVSRIDAVNKAVKASLLAARRPADT